MGNVVARLAVTEDPNGGIIVTSVQTLPAQGTIRSQLNPRIYQFAGNFDPPVTERFASEQEMKQAYAVKGATLTLMGV